MKVHLKYHLKHRYYGDFTLHQLALGPIAITLTKWTDQRWHVRIFRVRGI